MLTEAERINLPFEFEADWPYLPGSSVRIRCAFNFIGKRISIREFHYYRHGGETGPGWVEMDMVLGDICEDWLLKNHAETMTRFAKSERAARIESLKELEAERS